MNSLHQNQPQVATDLESAREYLAFLEALAHFGRLSENPHEVAAALKIFAEPSDALRHLAGVAGREAHRS